MLARQLAQLRKYGREALRVGGERRHRHQAAHLDAGVARLVEEAQPAPSGATPDFDSSPERFTSTSAGIVRRRAADERVERVAELAQLRDVAGLARLEVADEVPAERVAVARVLLA